MLLLNRNVLLFNVTVKTLEKWELLRMLLLEAYSYRIKIIFYINDVKNFSIYKYIEKSPKQ